MCVTNTKCIKQNKNNFYYFYFALYVLCLIHTNVYLFSRLWNVVCFIIFILLDAFSNTKRIKQNKNNKTDHIWYSREKINMCVTNTKCIKQNKNNKTDLCFIIFILLYAFFVCYTNVYLFSRLWRVVCFIIFFLLYAFCVCYTHVYLFSRIWNVVCFIIFILLYAFCVCYTNVYHFSRIWNIKQTTFHIPEKR
jgi:hypothetical protein